jgi:hypothetical protein
MGYHKLSSYVATFSVALCVALAPFSLETPPLSAQPLYVSIKFPRTPVGAPRTAIGGGTRGGRLMSEVSLSSPLTVLSPQNNIVTTVSDQPTLYWYIPKTEAKSADFVVYNPEGKLVYQTKVALEGIPGVVKLSLPRTLGLKIGQEYDWTLTLEYNPENEEQYRSVGGKLKRTALTSTQKAQLALARQPLKQAEVYAQAGIWQETISILAQLHFDRPSDRNINAAWKELLESVELKEIANAPLVECCRADN